MTQGIFPPPSITQAMALISRQEFSAAGEVAFNSVFTPAYKSYVLVVESVGTTSANSSQPLRFQFKYNATSVENTFYYGAFVRAIHNSTPTTLQMSNASQGTLTDKIGTLDSRDFTGSYTIRNVGRGVGRDAVLTGQGFNGEDLYAY